MKLYSPDDVLRVWVHLCNCYYQAITV